MMHYPRTTILSTGVALVFLLSALGPAAAKEPEKAAKGPERAAVTKELSTIIRALYKPDYDLLLKHTHGNVIKLAGGKDSFLAVMKQTHKLVTDAGVSIEKIEYGKKFEYFTGTEREFLIIPTTITIKNAEGTQEIPGTQLGVKKKSEKIWKYIDCSALNEEMGRKWFPDYPEDRKFPKG